MKTQRCLSILNKPELRIINKGSVVIMQHKRTKRPMEVKVACITSRPRVNRDYQLNQLYGRII